ncbi:thioredoxin family protein [Lysinibacillus agricola]|uniref:Thioredoxin family protein n=1 Tax=Lysinibacillus agricola TaxID=2590012 RepID=A0ABX7ALU8_9BACI|nr:MULTISPECIES: glutaredoxin domain-containing protein [Lysinibacillus]QQP10716.1 thioredoxin family protein [Lysinibacillus agricola]
MKNKLTLIKRSTPMCPDCNKMQIILEGEGIPFDTIDIAKDAEAIEKYGLSSVPVILIDSDEGQVKLNGIQPIEVIKELLEEE